MRKKKKVSQNTCLKKIHLIPKIYISNKWHNNSNEGLNQ